MRNPSAGGGRHRRPDRAYDELGATFPTIPTATRYSAAAKPSYDRLPVRVVADREDVREGSGHRLGHLAEQLHDGELCDDGGLVDTEKPQAASSTASSGSQLAARRPRRSP